MKVLVIGAVAGGANTATRLRRLDKNAEIIIFERGAYLSYATCGLPYYVGGKVKSSDALVLMTPGSFRERYDIDARIFNCVKSINRAARTITVENSRTGEIYRESYDKLVIATGTEPVYPPILGLDSQRVFRLHTIPDADKILKFISEKKPKSAVILGGGAVGMETAENLKLLGMDVAVAELAEHLVTQLDSDMSDIIRRYIEEQGVKVYLNNGAKSVEDTGDSLIVKLREGEIKTDMLILGVGVRPNSELAKEAGLEVSERGAIITNKQMLTSDPNIYAVGDVVQTYNCITGKPAGMPLAGPANRQARTAAGNIAGINCEYQGVQGTGIIKIFEMTAAFTGLSERDAQRDGADYDKVVIKALPCAEYYPGARPMNIKVVFDRVSGKILGAQVVGFEGADKRCDILALAVRMGATYEDLAVTDFAYSPPYGSPRDPVNVIGQVIDNLIKKQG